MQTIHTEPRDGLIVVRFDHPAKSVNTLSSATLDELGGVLTSIEQASPKPTGVIFCSGKGGVFVAGADLYEMRDLNRAQTEQFLRRGQELYNRIAALPCPTVAAINGLCLGGGTELSLACTWRVAVDDGSIRIGLPETKLGILPAWGGTTRLPKLIGIRKALPVILAGSTLSPRKAMKMGVIDEVVRPEALMRAAERLARTKRPAHRPPLIDRAIMGIAPLRDLVCDIARKQARAETRGNYPAADKVIDVVRTACRDGERAGFDAERAALGELVETDACRNLMRLFFLRQQSKQQVRGAASGDAMPVHHAAVIGGGVMGAGICHALITAGIPVRLVEVSPEAVSAALGRVKKMLDADRRAYRLSPIEVTQAMHRLSPTTDYTGLKQADLIIEAVLERMDVKRQVFEKLDAVARPDAILASNTSSMSITELAEMTRRPDRVIGLHFFNPVNKMPLVEVIRTKHTDPTAPPLATGVELAMRLGKTPIVVGDGPGFLVNRVLIPYMAEALLMAAEGMSITTIDDAMKDWGMPMGPFELLDHVGIDIAADILGSVGDRLPHPLPAPRGIERIVEKRWLGRKTDRGFYDYRKNRLPIPGRNKRKVNDELIALLTAGDPGTGDHRAGATMDAQAIQWRLVLPMVNEAVRVLDEQIADDADTIDLATVLGLGLAPFRGGLMHFAETVGWEDIHRRMSEHAATFGPHHAPAKAMRQMERGEPKTMNRQDAKDNKVNVE